MTSALSNEPAAGAVASAFAAFDAQRAGELVSVRRRAFERFTALGLPTRKLEGWKYTSARLGDIANDAWSLAARPGALPSAAELDALGLGAIDAVVLTVVDGVLVPELSDVVDLGTDDAVYAGSLTRAPAEQRALVEEHLGATAALDAEAFAELNTAFLADAVLIHLPRGTNLRRPLHIRYVATHGGARHPRCVLIARDNSEAMLLESFTSTGSCEGYVDNAVTQIILGSGARLRHLRLQDEGPAASHLATVHLQAGRDSDYSGHMVSLGAALARTALYVQFQATGASARLYGLGIATGRQHQDTFVVVDHAAPHCTSDVICKKIVDGRATTVFNAKALVREGAQQTDANQQNNNLLLSEGATANTMPQLEIYADDVKCAHGATVGQLDEDQIFYLRARGIGREEARRILTYAFAQEILAGIPDEPLRERLGELVRLRFTRPLAGNEK